METFESRQMRAGLLRKLRDCFIYNPDHTLVLSSGRKSNFFIDCRRVTLDPDGALLVGRLVLAAAQSDDPDAIGGLTIGADPIATAVALLSVEASKPLPAFLIRKDPKPLTRPEDPSAYIEGNLKKGARVVVVDDVLTSGRGTLRAIKILEEIGCSVVQVITLVDRMEGAKEFLEAEGYRVRSLFTMKDLLKS
jgi:orotate phosphoribosyltransferase